MHLQDVMQLDQYQPFIIIQGPIAKPIRLYRANGIKSGSNLNGDGNGSCCRVPSRLYRAGDNLDRAAVGEASSEKTLA